MPTKNDGVLEQLLGYEPFFPSESGNVCSVIPFSQRGLILLLMAGAGFIAPLALEAVGTFPASTDLTFQFNALNRLTNEYRAGVITNRYTYRAGGRLLVPSHYRRLLHFHHIWQRLSTRLREKIVSVNGAAMHDAYCLSEASFFA